MRRVLVVAVSLVVILGTVAPALAQAPAPKVTINGLLDFVTTGYRNWSGGTCINIGPGGTGVGSFGGDTCPGGDVTKPNDKNWYSRERGVLTITGEVGKSKGVWAFELDFTNGVNSVGTGAGNGLGQRGSVGNSFPGTTTGADLDTDVAGSLETKWLYLETPITGPGSMLPFIPIETLVRAGMQPATGHDYKVGILLDGDIPGVALVTTWAPNLRSTVTFVQMREGLDKKTNQTSNNFATFLNEGTGTVQPTPAGGGDTRTTVAGARGQESWALVNSVEFDVFKGLTVKPTYAYAEFEGGSGNFNLGMQPANGFSVNGTRLNTHRHTLGGDVRWTSGPFYVQPTYYYQWGDQDICTPGEAPACFVAGTTKRNVDIRTWIFDTQAGFRTGPLNVEVRGMWTPGMSSQRQVQRGADVGYYLPINPGFSYMAGWTEIQTSGIDYITATFGGAPGVSLRTSPSYDKYGRRMIAVATDYSLTPALTFHGVINASWTDEKVDTTSFLTAAGLNQTGPLGTGVKGTDRYLGTELDAGLTYRFAPNVALDIMGAYLSAGHAMDHARSVADSLAGKAHNARDIEKVTARVRVTF